jgi:uncharacterized lipoprotein YmbA
MKRLLLVASLALLAGCGTPAKISYYTLTAQDTARRPASDARGLKIYVGPVTIPEGVDRPQMVIRTSPNQVEIADLDRWGEPLKAAIPRLVAETLSRELGSPDVMTSRQSATLDFDYRVAIDISRFDFSAGEGAAVDAAWTLRAAKGSSPPRTGQARVREAGGAGGPQAMAAAQSRAIEKIAADIAEAVRAQPRP